MFLLILGETFLLYRQRICRTRHTGNNLGHIDRSPLITRQAWILAASSALSLIRISYQHVYHCTVHTGVPLRLGDAQGEMSRGICPGGPGGEVQGQVPRGRCPGGDVQGEVQGEMSRGDVEGEMSRGRCPGGDVEGEMPRGRCPGGDVQGRCPG